MFKYIEDNIGKITFIFLVIFAIEFGIGCWRLPNEFRSNIIPKLNSYITYYTEINKSIKELDNEINKNYNEFITHKHKFLKGTIIIRKEE